MELQQAFQLNSPKVDDYFCSSCKNYEVNKAAPSCKYPEDVCLYDPIVNVLQEDNHATNLC